MYANLHFSRKVVLLVCIKSTLIMSLPARTINKTALKAGVPLLSLLGSILFRIFINEILYFIEGDLCHFADENTLSEIDNSTAGYRRYHYSFCINYLQYQ